MIIALNNKSNLGKKEFEIYKTKLEKLKTKNKLILIPTFLNISQSIPTSISLGAQNVSCFENGAFTGEISAAQLKSYGVNYCIVGHSERRKYQKEANNEIREKIKQLLSKDIIPILCLGETLEERRQKKVKEKIKDELLTAIEGLTEEEEKKIIIAYEPIWAIGTGIVPTTKEITEVLAFIKEICPESPLLYGGSVNEENIETLRRVNIIEGFLIGGLSLNIEKLALFLQKCN